MTSYLPRTGGQKKNILHQKELELRAEIRRKGTNTNLKRRAEKVRVAQQGVIKALLAEERSESARRKLMKKKEHWATISVDEIIRIYSNPTDSSPDIQRKKFWDTRRM